MGKAKRRPKKHLSFRALLDSLGQHIVRIPDSRDPERCNYTLQECYQSGFAMFYLQDPSLLEFQRRFQSQIQMNNLTTVFGVEKIPSDSQFRRIIDMHSYDPILDVFSDYFKRLQRGKVLEKYQYLDGNYLLAIDGSEYFTSEKIYCKKCLITESKDGTRYHHQILQTTLVHPAFRQVIPLAPEFIRNEDGNKKQDCERNAAKRLIPKIKQAHKILPAIIIADDLYSNQPFIELLQDNRYSYILVCKPTDHKHLFRDIDGLRRGKLLESCVIKDKKGKRYVYEWTNNVELNGRSDSIHVNFVEFSIYNGTKRTYHNSFVTDIPIDRSNVEKIVKGGRAKWKIENEGFNTLKNHGYHLEHNFGHGEKNLSEAFFILNLLAFLVHQILELTDAAYQEARGRFSARKEYWNIIRAVFRLMIFRDWEEVLFRMNSPPQPIFPENGNT